MEYHKIGDTKCPELYTIVESDSEDFMLELSCDNNEKDEDQYLLSYSKFIWLFEHNLCLDDTC